MLIRALFGLMMICIGLFGLYSAFAKAGQLWAVKPVDKATGIPKVITRVVRCILALILVTIGVLVVLQAIGVIARA